MAGLREASVDKNTSSALHAYFTVQTRDADNSAAAIRIPNLITDHRQVTPQMGAIACTDRIKAIITHGTFTLKTVIQHIEGMGVFAIA